MNLRLIPKKIGFKLVLLLSVLGACVPGNKDNRQPPKAESGDPADATLDPEIEELSATDPIGIAGVNLVADYDNTRARCDFKNTEADIYEIFCQVTITSDLGSEFIPLKVKDTLQLAWQKPVQSKGAFRLDRCQESSDHLSLQCYGQLTSGTAALGFPLQITDTLLLQSRTEHPEVLLPYFVGVIEGDFSDTHRSYTRIPEPDSAKSMFESQPVQAGFFRSRIDRFDHKVNVQDACDHEDLVILASPTYIYIYDSKKDEVRPIAGRFDENVRFSYQFEDPMRLNHQTYRVVCGKNGFTTFHANSGWDIDSNGVFSSALRALRFDYSGRLRSYVDTLTDQVSGRVAVHKTNLNLAAPGGDRQRVTTVSSFDGDRFIVVDVLKSTGKLEWVASTFAPDGSTPLTTRVVQSLDISSGDVITPGLVDASVLARFVRDQPELLVYSGYCHYAIYDLNEGRMTGEVGPKKSVMTGPGSCADDTVIPGREFSRFGKSSFIFKLNNETYRTVDSQQQIRSYSSGSFDWLMEPVDLLKQGLVQTFDGRFPAGSKSYPMSGERMLLTNTEYLGLIRQDKLQLISANNRLRAPEVGRINNIFWESSTQKILRVYNRIVAEAAIAVVEEFEKDRFVPLLEIPCSVIVRSGTCAELIFKTAGQSASFLVTTPGPDPTGPDQSDIISYDTSLKLLTNGGTYPTPRGYRYRNTRGESLSSYVVLRHESQSTFVLFDTSTGVTTALNVSANTFLDASSVYSINDDAGTLDLLVAKTFASDPSKAFSVYRLDLVNPTSTPPQLGLISVPAAASASTPLPYTAPQDGLAPRMDIGFQANAKAFDQQSNLYFYFASGLYMAAPGSSKLVKLLDLESAPDCGGRAFQGEVKETELKVSLKTTMKNLCYNKTDGLFVSNDCTGKDGFLNFFIRQYYGSESANLTLVTAPCSLLP